jgi:hypothetical protein
VCYLPRHWLAARIQVENALYGTEAADSGLFGTLERPALAFEKEPHML